MTIYNQKHLKIFKRRRTKKYIKSGDRWLNVYLNIFINWSHVVCGVCMCHRMNMITHDSWTQSSKTRPYEYDHIWSQSSKIRDMKGRKLQKETPLRNQDQKKENNFTLDICLGLVSSREIFGFYLLYWWWGKVSASKLII